VNRLRQLSGRYRVGDDPLRTLRRIELVALLLGLLLCLQLAWGALRLFTLAAPGPVAPAADSLQVPAVVGPVLVAAAGRNEIISRPLFWSGRRPVDTVAALADPGSKAGSLPGELSGVKLLGVFGSGKQAGVIALVQDQKRRILLGDTVEGWTLESITPHTLVVSNGERSETLALQQGAVSARPARAPAAAASQGESRAKAADGSSGDNRLQGAAAGLKLRKREPGAAAAAPPAADTPAPAAAAEAEPTLGLGPGDRDRGK
jgi:hypothetical protein